MIAVTRHGETFNIEPSFINAAKNWYKNHSGNLSVNGNIKMGVFIGEYKQSKPDCSSSNSTIASIPLCKDLKCSANRNINSDFCIFFSPYEFKNGQVILDSIDPKLQTLLGKGNNVPPASVGDCGSHLLYPVEIYNNDNLVEYKKKNPDKGMWSLSDGIPSIPAFNRSAGIILNKKESKNMKNKNKLSKKAISENMYNERMYDLATSSNGIALIFDTTIRELPKKIIKPILERFNSKLLEAGISPVEAIDMPLVSFLGKNDIWTLGEDLIIPIHIKKLKMKPGSTVEEFDVTYIDLTTMTVRKNDRGDLLNHIRRVILSNQEAKKLQINALIKNRNDSINKLKSMDDPSKGGFPAIIFMSNKLNRLLDGRIASLKIQIKHFEVVAADYSKNSLLIGLEEESETEMEKPFGKSVYYNHPSAHLKTILRKMHYDGQLQEVMRQLEDGTLQKRVNPTNHPALLPVFEALKEFGAALLSLKEEKSLKEESDSNDRYDSFDEGISELPVLKEINKIQEMETTDIPIETTSLTPNQYKADSSREFKPKMAIKSISRNLSEAEQTKEKLDTIRGVILELYRNRSLRDVYLSSNRGISSINALEDSFKKLHGFVTKYRNPVYSESGQIDKVKIGKSADPLANLNISEYILLLNTKIKVLIDRYRNKQITVASLLGSSLKKMAQGAAPPPDAGAMPGMPGMPGMPAAGGSIAGDVLPPDPSKINDETEDDEKELDKLRNAFDNAYEAGNSIEDSTYLAIQAAGSRRPPSQIDVAVVPDEDYPEFDAPFIRSVSGVELGLPDNTQQPPTS